MPQRYLRIRPPALSPGCALAMPVNSRFRTSPSGYSRSRAAITEINIYGVLLALAQKGRGERNPQTGATLKIRAPAVPRFTAGAGV